MRHSIPYHIREQLREHRSVSIPGLGMFYLTHQSASISDDKKHVSPPTLALSFDEVAGDEVPLLHRIMRVENIGLQKVKKKLSKYTESIFNMLINLNKVEIEGIGTLIRSENEVIKFEDTVAVLTDEFHGLRDIDLQPVKRLAAVSGEGDTGSNQMVDYTSTGSTSTDGKPRRPWWIPLLGGILLAIVYVLTMKTCDKQNTTPVGGIDEVEETIGDGSEVLLDSLGELAIGESQGEDVAAEDIGAEEVTDETAVYEESDIAAAEITEEIEEIEEVAEPEDIEVLADNQSLIPTDKSAVIKADADEIDYSQGDSEQSAIKSVAYDGTTCIVIVGSFTKAKNVLKMMEKVENLGYVAYSAAYGQFTRVGLKFNCKQSDLPIYLAEVQNNLDKKAWYLEAPGR